MCRLIEIALKRKSLLNCLNDTPNCDKKLKTIENAIADEMQSETKDKDIKRVAKCFWLDYDRRWKKAQRKKEKFETDNADWLEGCITFNEPEEVNFGRPQKEFDQLSERMKRQRTEELRSKYSTDELVYAAQMSLRANGEIEAAKKLKNRNQVCI